jgi:hypothetical protein
MSVRESRYRSLTRGVVQAMRNHASVGETRLERRKSARKSAWNIVSVSQEIVQVRHGKIHGLRVAEDAAI